MSIHPSLKLSDKDKKQRLVLKRIERLRIMMEKDQWKPGDEVCGLPKIKTLRIKIKKEKAKELVEAAATEGAAPAELETKEQARALGPASKSQDKK
ncbi:MAG: small basic protein [Candidatus Omnitrophica bacterium CG23_combo_of_CG06-09_8_20_14_all_40_11]|nr:MAG: small basic protein [Candidatus Omnitrophica bacterium CG23_combo_of_CG06-09_8_20_14_all_40_11]